MAGSRSTPPLFDLLRPGGAERQDEVKPTPQARPAPPPPPPPQARTAPAVNKPIVRLDTAPKPAAAAPAPRPAVTPSPRAEPAPAPRPRVTESPAKSGTRQSITVGVVWVWLAVAGVFASWLLIWGVAYTAGRSEATQRLSRFEPAGSPPPVVTRQPSAPTKQPVPTDKAPAGPATGKVPVAPKATPTAPALPAADTRQAGLNYLLCASLLDKAAAEAAAGFLTQNNIPAAAVPTKGRPGKYSVYTLLGIPSDSFNDQLKVRNDHRSEVARLGQQWRKDHPGAPDFSDALWDKYKP